MKKLEFETSKGNFVLVDRNNYEFLELICKYEPINIKQITEEQASEIVDSIDSQVSFKTSLNILLKSKGVHLFKNPAPILHQDRLRQEQNTFYNPYIFKLC